MKPVSASPSVPCSLHGDITQGLSGSFFSPLSLSDLLFMQSALNGGICHCMPLFNVSHPTFSPVGRRMRRLVHLLNRHFLHMLCRTSAHQRCTQIPGQSESSVMFVC